MACCLSKDNTNAPKCGCLLNLVLKQSLELTDKLKVNGIVIYSERVKLLVCLESFSFAIYI